MPIWLRRFTFETLKEYYEKQNEEAEKQQNMLKNKSNKDIARPNIAPSKTPTYIAKAPKK
jgi:predicted double-glycine peptidase